MAGFVTDTDFFGKVDIPLVTPIDDLDIYPVELSASRAGRSRGDIGGDDDERVGVCKVPDAVYKRG